MYVCIVRIQCQPSLPSVHSITTPSTMATGGTRIGSKWAECTLTARNMLVHHTIRPEGAGDLMCKKTATLALKRAQRCCMLVRIAVCKFSCGGRPLGVVGSSYVYLHIACHWSPLRQAHTNDGCQVFHTAMRLMSKARAAHCQSQSSRKARVR